ncbi:head-tail connector protein [Pseudacidovorax sp. RU35E]|uniref:head-tail connector protein n=1 Tax=Pseudacidovorax sp. RU35E TaxID=1907403 RepID=UPI000955C751|nr:head-tail connector protein [Pseudacidovorax sp. RU35E]SIQ99977.1 hypothetical protein SAMN05880557_10782 [Pseudacidovorax sp. RU35E]
MLLDLATARRHLRVDDDYPEAQVLPYLLAAEDAAQQFLNRAVYATQQQLDDARGTVTTLLTGAVATREAAYAAADAQADEDVRCMLRGQAVHTYAQAKTDAQRIALGIVLNDSIRAAVLLTLGHLFEHREDVAAALQELPKGARSLLWPYRIGLGV